MARILMENFEASDIIALHAEGKKFSILLEDDADFIFEISEAQLKTPVEKSKGFRISKDSIEDINFENYSEIHEDEDGKKYIKAGDKDNRSRDAYGRMIIRSEEIDAYITEFGSNKLKLKKDIKVKKEKEIKEEKYKKDKK